jgi:hypothetical protein
MDNTSKAFYPSSQKYGWTRGEVDDLRAELERLRLLVEALQDRVTQLERAGQR